MLSNFYKALFTLLYLVVMRLYTSFSSEDNWSYCTRFVLLDLSTDLNIVVVLENLLEVDSSSYFFIGILAYRLKFSKNYSCFTCIFTNSSMSLSFLVTCCGFSSSIFAI